jgi:tetratricopeptide (TPR) repeat protein
MEGRVDNIQNARILFSAGLKKCPNHVPLYQGWASLELRAGNLDVAKKLITDALTRDKTQGSGWAIAARIEELQGNDGLVGLLLRRGIECAPYDPTLYRVLGDYLVSKGKIDDARQIMEEGLEIDPTHAPLYHSLAELEARVFNVEGLAKLNKRAAAIFNKNALESVPSSSRIFGDKIRREKSSPSVPYRVQRALGEKIGDVTEAKSSASFDSIIQWEHEIFDDYFADDLTRSDESNSTE